MGKSIWVRIGESMQSGCQLMMINTMGRICPANTKAFNVSNVINNLNVLTVPDNMMTSGESILEAIAMHEWS